MCFYSSSVLRLALPIPTSLAQVPFSFCQQLALLPSTTSALSPRPFPGMQTYFWASWDFILHLPLRKIFYCESRRLVPGHQQPGLGQAKYIAASPWSSQPELHALFLSSFSLVYQNHAHSPFPSNVLSLLPIAPSSPSPPIHFPHPTTNPILHPMQLLHRWLIPRSRFQKKNL